jgi:hypothetical protein
MGHVFGNNPIWHFDGPGLFPVGSTWQQAMSSPGTASMEHFGTVFSGLAWWQLVPDITNTFLRDGVGNGNDRAAAAVSQDRSLAVVYIPSKRQVTLDLSRMAGASVTLTWFDPTSGQMSPAEESAMSTGGTLSVEPKEKNAEGSGDWVLIAKSS